MDSTAPATKRLAGKVAIFLTGGASGIGVTTAHIFSENGATVVVAEDEPIGQSLQGSNVSFLRCNVCEEEQVRAAIDAVVAHHGKLDILLVAHNHNTNTKVSILDDESSLDSVIQGSLNGSFFGAKHAARVMIPAKSGCILLSVTGPQGSRDFSMSKYGVVGLVRNLSPELAPHGIRVNCISGDGVVDAESVAKAALFLASEDANHVNGHNLVLSAEEEEKKVKFSAEEEEKKVKLTTIASKIG